MFFWNIWLTCVLLHFISSPYKSAECTFDTTPKNTAAIRGGIAVISCATDKKSKGNIIWEMQNYDTTISVKIYDGAVSPFVASYISVNERDDGSCDLKIKASAIAAKRYICKDRDSGDAFSAELTVLDRDVECNGRTDSKTVNLTCSISSNGDSIEAVECDQNNYPLPKTEIINEGKTRTWKYTSHDKSNNIICSVKFMKIGTAPTRATNIPDAIFSTLAYQGKGFQTSDESVSDASLATSVPLTGVAAGGTGTAAGVATYWLRYWKSMLTRTLLLLTLFPKLFMENFERKLKIMMRFGISTKIIKTIIELKPCDHICYQNEVSTSDFFHAIVERVVDKTTVGIIYFSKPPAVNQGSEPPSSEVADGPPSAITSEAVINSTGIIRENEEIIMKLPAGEGIYRAVIKIDPKVIERYSQSAIGSKAVRNSRGIIGKKEQNISEFPTYGQELIPIPKVSEPSSSQVVSVIPSESDKNSTGITRKSEDNSSKFAANANIHRIDYKKDVSPTDKVIERMKGVIDKTSAQSSSSIMVFVNCEQFAVWTKTGEDIVMQSQMQE